MTRTSLQVKRYDLFKLVVTLLLILLLIALLIRACGTRPAPTPAPGAGEAEVTAEPAVEREAEAPELEISAPTLDVPGAGAELAAGGLTLSGTGTPGTGAPGAGVQILVDGEVVGVAPVGSDGKWSFTAQVDEPGEHEIVVQALDAGGEVAAAAGPVALMILPAIAVPTLDLPGAGAELPVGKVALSGTGTPGTEVQILVDGQVVGVAPVGSDGRWTFTAQVDEPGEHEIVVQALDASGGVAAVSEPVALTVGPAVAMPTLEFPAPGAALPAGELTLTGTGTPGTEVEILDNGEVIGVAQVGQDGLWSFAFTPEPGDHCFAVRPAGVEEMTSGEVAVSVQGPAAGAAACAAVPGTCTGESYTVVRGDWMACIARCAEVSLAALIAANPQIEDPDLIYPDQVINIPR